MRSGFDEVGHRSIPPENEETVPFRQRMSGNRHLSASHGDYNRSSLPKRTENGASSGEFIFRQKVPQGPPRKNRSIPQVDPQDVFVNGDALRSLAVSAVQCPQRRTRNPGSSQETKHEVDDNDCRFDARNEHEHGGCWPVQQVL